MPYHSLDLVDLEPAERHRRVATRFGELLAETPDWHAPTPVPEWQVLDIPSHLLEWFPGFLAGGDVRIPAATVPPDDPIAAWSAQSAAIQALLDDPTVADAEFSHPMAGTHRLADAVDRFYTGDVMMHAWDLGRSIGVEPALDDEFSARMLEGMRHIDELLRSSGQYGPAQPVADAASPTDQLMAFVGRDPNWSPT